MQLKQKLPRIGFFFIFISLLSISIIISLIPIKTETNRNLKVMTWNISGAIGVDDVFNVERVIDEIKANDPDIIGLQEVDIDMGISSIADDLNMYYYYVKAGDTNEGNALLSKYPIIESESIDLPLIDGKRARVLIKSKILINHREWEIYVTHFSRYDKPKDHLNQAKFVSSILSKSRTTRIILMGDLNFGPSSTPHSELINNENFKLRDTYEFLNDDLGYTFRSNYLFKRIDYIFCSLNLKPTESEVITTRASDHYAVITTF